MNSTPFAIWSVAKTLLKGNKTQNKAADQRQLNSCQH